MASGTVSSVQQPNWQLIQTNTTTSGTTSTFTGLSGYSQYLVTYSFSSGAASPYLNFNSDSTSGNYAGYIQNATNISVMSTAIPLHYQSNTASSFYGYVTISNANQTTPKFVSGVTAAAPYGGIITSSYFAASAITSITITTNTGTFSSGTITLYGIAA